jgi:hypothetical protein
MKEVLDYKSSFVNFYKAKVSKQNIDGACKKYCIT